MSPGDRRLPHFAAWLVARLAPPDLRHDLLDDLDEEFREIETHHGRREARRWLKRQLWSADWLRLRPEAGRTNGADLPSMTARRTSRRNSMTLVDDIRTAARTLGRQPRYALSVILTVAVGILGATAMLGVFETVLLRPLPDDMDEVVALRTFNQDGTVTNGPVSWVNLNEWRELDVFDGVLGIQGVPMTLRGRGAAEALSVARVSVEALSVLGITPVAGRGFRPDEGTPGQDRVAMLTHARWQSMFEGSPDAIGQALRLDDALYEIIGVLPAGATLPSDMGLPSGRDVWVPLAPTLEQMPRKRRAVMGHARLADGVTLADARAALDVAFANQQRLDPEANERWHVRLQTMTETVVGPFRPVLSLMLGAASLLLLLACANLTNLMLAHWARRRRELAVRTALGAGRARLVRHLLAQGAMLGLAGGALGVMGSYALVALVAHITPGNVPRLAEAAISPRLAFAMLGGAGLLGMLFACGPAAVFAGHHRIESSGGGGGGRAATGSRWEHRTLGAMVTVQLALAVALLTGAGLLSRSFVQLVAGSPGFDVDRIATSLVMLVPPQYPDEASRQRFTTEALARFATVPGVTRVGVTNFLPFSGANTVDGFSVNGLTPSRQTAAGFRAVDDGYFDVLQIPILRGRGFTAEEAASDAPVAMISETLAQQFFGEVEPLGRFIQRGGAADDEPGWREIIGIVGDVRHEAPDRPVIPEWYAPYAGDPYRLKFFVLKTSVPSDTVIPAARSALGELNPDLAPMSVQTMSAYLESHVAGPRFNVAMLAAFAVTAIVIAAVGLFGVMTNAVAARSREFGIRLALGAGRRQIRNQLVRQAVTLTVPGIGLGLAGAALLSDLLVSVLRGVSPYDPFTYIAVTTLALLVVVAASYLPARRATRVDPTDALRAE